MSEPIKLDTTFSEPSATAGETDMLLFALERTRATFAWKVGGLDDAALHRTFPPSAMTLGGMLKHLALVEDLYVIDFAGRPPGPPWEHIQDNPGWDWTSAADDSAEELYALWAGAVSRSRAALAEALADGGLDQMSKWAQRPVNLRRIVVDLHDEYARHVGHADLFREAIDGLVGEDPPH
jgi:hypothetical protein